MNMIDLDEYQNLGERATLLQVLGLKYNYLSIYLTTEGSQSFGWVN